MPKGSTEERGFVWPPRGGGALPAPIEASSPAPPSAPRPFLVALERFWLSPVSEPLARRMEWTGWRPDPFEAYCNRCGRTVGPHEDDEFGCAECRPRRAHIERFVRLGEHVEPLRAWVHEVKFARSRRLGRDLGALLGARLGAAGAPRSSTVVVPTPTTRLRRLERGVDHARLVALGVGESLGVPVVGALSRKGRPSQRAVSPSERERNVAGAFRLVRRAAIAGRTVILVDDVRTSGATLRAAARALRAGWGGTAWGTGGRPRVWAGVLGVAREPGGVGTDRGEAVGRGAEGGDG